MLQNKIPNNQSEAQIRGLISLPNNQPINLVQKLQQNKQENKQQIVQENKPNEYEDSSDYETSEEK